VSWQVRWKEIQQIASVAQEYQASLKAFSADIAKWRSDGALLVGCALLAQIVLKQSQYRNQGNLSATIKAALKQAATMGLSLGDFPTKLRTLVEGLNKGSGGESDAGTKESAGSTPEKRRSEDDIFDKKVKKEKKSDKKADVEVRATLMLVPVSFEPFVPCALCNSVLLILMLLLLCCLQTVC
jgi:hypothetical protein